MADISQLIDKKIDETFIIKAPKSYTAHTPARKTTTSLPPQTGRAKMIITPKVNIKEDRSLLMRAVKTRGETHEMPRSELLTTQAPTGKNLTDPWKAHKRLALLQHPLWVECMKSWWNVMDPHEIETLETGTDGKITMEQYLDLNVRLQKALSTDFDYEQACISAVDDWELDADDWDSTVSIGETQHPGTPNSSFAPSVVSEKMKTFNFDKFSDFLFEIGEAWCDGSIESILVLVNCAMLHVSQGVHMCSTVFKDIDVISPLPALLFQEIADLSLSGSPKSMEFMKWYQRNFLEISSMRSFVMKSLFKIMPHESRVSDLWISEEGYNQTEVLIQCTTRLEALLNRIQRANPVSLPITENSARKKILPNIGIVQSKQVTRRTEVPTLPSIKHNENEPVVYQNKIMFVRNVNLSLIGQSYSTRRKSQEIREHEKNSEAHSATFSKEIKVPSISVKPANSQKIGTDLSPLHTERSLSYDHLFQETTPKRPFSTPLHAVKKINLVHSSSYLQLPNSEAKKLFEEIQYPEYTPKLQFHKADVKFHKLQKQWRTGKFAKVTVDTQTPEVGEVNKKSPAEYYEMKRKTGKDMIKNMDSSRHSKTQDYNRSHYEKASPSRNEITEKKDSLGQDDIEKLVGIKITVNTPRKDEKSAKATQHKEEKVAQTAPPAQTRKEQKTVGAATYTFEDFSHLIRTSKPQQLVFKDSLEFLYALNRAKYEFNQEFQSEFLKNYHKRNNEYRSRRDELGGHISHDEWKRFIGHLEEIIRITRIRRKNRKLKRKKKGKKTGVRRGPNVARNRLWKNVFIKPFDNEKMKRDKYLREVKKIDGTARQVLPPHFEQILNESIKVPVPPRVPREKAKTRRYSPGRHRVIQA